MSHRGIFNKTHLLSSIKPTFSRGHPEEAESQPEGAERELKIKRDREGWICGVLYFSPVFPVRDLRDLRDMGPKN